MRRTTDVHLWARMELEVLEEEANGSRQRRKTWTQHEQETACSDEPAGEAAATGWSTTTVQAAATSDSTLPSNGGENLKKSEENVLLTTFTPSESVRMATGPSALLHIRAAGVLTLSQRRSLTKAVMVDLLLHHAPSQRSRTSTQTLGSSWLFKTPPAFQDTAGKRRPPPGERV